MISAQAAQCGAPEIEPLLHQLSAPSPVPTSAEGDVPRGLGEDTPWVLLDLTPIPPEPLWPGWR